MLLGYSKGLETHSKVSFMLFAIKDKVTKIIILLTHCFHIA